MGVLHADTGTVTWKGTPVDAAIRRSIGYMPEERGLPNERWPSSSSTWPAPTACRLPRGREPAERLAWSERRGDEVQSLSLGTSSVSSWLPRWCAPSCAILDEPFSGLDPWPWGVMTGHL